MSYRDHLAHKMNVLRTLIGSPHVPFIKHNRGGAIISTPQVGYVGCEHDCFAGYRLFEIVNLQGGERNLAEGLKVHECINFINGAIMALEGRISMYGDTDETG